MDNRENSGSFARQTAEPGIQSTRSVRAGWQELYLTATPLPGEAREAVFARLARAVHSRQARVVTQDVFGFPGDERAGAQGLRDAFGEVAWPLTWITGTGTPGGSQLWAVTGPEVIPVRVSDAIIGSVFEDEHLRYCRLGGITPHPATTDRESSTRQVLEQMAVGLSAAGMNFGHVVRTWFYLDDILAWYDQFNRVRTQFFVEQGVAGGLLPASTGIGFALPAPLVAGLLAVCTKQGAAVASGVASPLQGEASDYGSSFSRAVELDLGDSRQLLVSGTASVAPAGQTLYVGDLDGQIELTMNVVSALLAGRGYSWDDVVRALVYLRPGEDIAAFERYRARAGLSHLPVIGAEAMICRDDLLFEIELDAVRPGASSRLD